VGVLHCQILRFGGYGLLIECSRAACVRNAVDGCEEAKVSAGNAALIIATPAAVGD